MDSVKNIPDAQLTLEGVFDAYFDCRRTKRNSLNQLRFETNLEHNLVKLYHELADGSYQISRSVAFVVTYPKIREVWAADFRDRVVHHVIYRAIFNRFYRRFIRDSYACIPGRGTHDGLRRVTSFAHSITRDWTRPAYFLKADVANFFNSIDRQLLIGLAERHVHEEWVRTLIRQVVLHDPRNNVAMRSPQALFAQVPRHKSLLYAPDGKALPIGNLTSQFFANLYLNELDQFVKHKLKAKYYGRYVDDMVLFHEDAAVLNSWYSQMDDFLKANLCLHLHPNKKHLNRADTGIDFTGFIIKPGRTYLRQTSIANCKRKIRAWQKRGAPIDNKSLDTLSASMNSYLGMLRQVDGYKARRSLCRSVESLFIVADKDYTKIRPGTRKPDIDS